MKYRVGRIKSQIANGRKIDYFIRVDPNRVRLYQPAKQNLTSRAPAPDYRKLLREHLGLPSTDYLTPYVSLWARVETFEPRPRCGAKEES